MLLTATPEQLGIEGHFARLRLLDPARYSELEAFRNEEARYAPVNALVQTLLAENGWRSVATEKVQDRLENFLGKAALATLNAERERGDADPEELLDRLITEILDRHGTGRVLFRNTRASIEGFPKRKLHRHLLAGPATFDIDKHNDRPGAVLIPEQVLGEGWLLSDPRVSWLTDFLKQHRGEKILVICSRANSALEVEEHLRLKHGVHSAVFHEGLSLLQRDRNAAYFAAQIVAQEPDLAR